MQPLKLQLVFQIQVSPTYPLPFWMHTNLTVHPVGLKVISTSFSSKIINFQAISKILYKTGITHYVHRCMTQWSSFPNRNSELNSALVLWNVVLIILISLSFPLSSFCFFQLMKNMYAKWESSNDRDTKATQRDSNLHVKQVPHTIIYPTLWAQK